MTEKEFKKLKVGDKIKAVMQICYDLNPPQYISKGMVAEIVKITPRQCLIYCDFGSNYPENVPCVAFEVEND